MANLKIPNMHKNFTFTMSYSIEDSSRLSEGSLDSSRRFASSEHPELYENCNIFDHGAEGADEPRQICKEVLLFN
jgi:hypothetical protein